LPHQSGNAILSDIDDLVAATRSGLASRRNLRALDYWNQQRGERPMPARADLDPADIVSILPHVILLDVQDDPLDFRYRLIGTAIVNKLHRNLTGQWMRDIPYQAPPSSIHEACQRVVEQRRPISSTISYIGPNQNFFSAEDVIMPLSIDGEKVNMLFVTVEYLRKV
jgi:hypothetical protein